MGANVRIPVFHQEANMYHCPMNYTEAYRIRAYVELRMLKRNSMIGQ